MSTFLWARSLPFFTRRRSMFGESSRRASQQPAIIRCCVDPLEARTMLTTFTVDSLSDQPVDVTTVPDGELTLREALAAASSGQSVGDAVYEADDDRSEVDTIEFADGLTGTIRLAAGELTYSGAGQGGLTIEGDGITIDAARSSRIFRLEPAVNVALEGLTLINGDAAGVGALTGDGGAIFVASTDQTVTLFDTTIANSAAINGGGIYNAGSTVRVFGGGIDGGAADGNSGSGGGIYSADGTLILGATSVTNSVANASGGGIEVASGVAFFNQATIDNNVAGPDGAANPGNGGGIHVGDGVTLTLQASIVSNNTAAADGGGVWLGSGGTALLRDDTQVTGNIALGDDPGSGGGGIYNDGSRLTARGLELTGNEAAGDNGRGGGILNQAGLIDLAASTIAGNAAALSGGGVEVAGGTVYLIGSQLGVAGGGNSADAGGGLHIGSDSSVVVLDGGRVTANEARIDGGGVWVGEGSRLVARNATVFEDNSATGGEVRQGGGAIYNAGGRVDLFTGQLIANTAIVGSGSGGGVLSASGVFVAANVTIDENVAARAGGGIEVGEGAVYLFSSSLGGGIGAAGNSATGVDGDSGNGGGLHVTGQTATVVVDGGTVRNNVAAGEGGGLWNQAGSTLVLRNGVQVTRNEARGDDSDQGGGAIFNNGGRVVLFGGRVSNNSADGAAGSGGAILSTGGVVEVARTTLARNTAIRAGGAVEVIDGIAYFAEATIGGQTPQEANVALGNEDELLGNGGAIHTTGIAAVTIDGGSVQNNIAAGEGGALWNASGSRLIVRNGAFVADNTAAGPGGGIFNLGRVDVRNAQLVRNLGDAFGDGFVDDPSFTPNPDDPQPAPEILAGGGLFNSLAGTAVFVDTTLINNAVGEDQLTNEFAGPGQTLIFTS